MLWIETQDLFFKQYKFKCFIEVGPSPMLVGIATRTLRARYGTRNDSTGLICQVFCSSKDQKEIYYQFKDEPKATSKPDAPANAANPSPTSVAAMPVIVATPPPTITVGPAASLKDVPIRAVKILAVIVSQKLKKQLSGVPLSKSIEELSNSKSTLQNEIMGDLQGKFSSAPDKGKELLLEELGAALESGHAGNLSQYSTGLMLRAISGFNILSAKSHLSKTMGSGSLTC